MDLIGDSVISQSLAILNRKPGQHVHALSIYSEGSGEDTYHFTGIVVIREMFYMNADIGFLAACEVARQELLNRFCIQLNETPDRFSVIQHHR